MDFKNFISGINFEFIQPLDAGIGLFTNLLIESTVDIKNTILPERDAEMKKILQDVCRTPRMSTFAIGSIINLIVSEMNPDHAFVNVGVWHGYTLLCGMANNPGKRCIGIDNFSEFGGPRDEFLQRFNLNKSERHEFHDMDYIDYFSKIHSGTIGFYIYDGNHSKENQFKGLQVAEPFFADDCYILVDDINWPDPAEGTREFIEQSSSEYEVIAEEKTSHNCHPTYWNGISLLRKKG